MEREFWMEKKVPSGTISVVFHVYPEKVHIVTIGSWRGAGHTAFSETVEAARAEWKRLIGEGFKRVKG